MRFQGLLNNIILIVKKVIVLIFKRAVPAPVGGAHSLPAHLAIPLADVKDMAVCAFIRWRTVPVTASVIPWHNPLAGILCYFVILPVTL